MNRWQTYQPQAHLSLSLPIRQVQTPICLQQQGLRLILSLSEEYLWRQRRGHGRIDRPRPRIFGVGIWFVLCRREPAIDHQLRPSRVLVHRYTVGTF